MRTGKRKTRIRARRPASPRPPGVERVIEGMRVAGVPAKRTVRYLEDRFGGAAYVALALEWPLSLELRSFPRRAL